MTGRSGSFLVALGLVMLSTASPVRADDATATPAVVETVVTREFVPSSERRVGEVRLLRRNGERVVQTLLYTKLLDRVVREIASKEAKNWPKPITGHDDAQRYLEGLRAAEEALPKPDEGSPDVDRQRRLLIEFRREGDVGIIDFATFELEGERDDLRVVDRKPIQRIEVSAAYAQRNMDLIAADAFDVPEQKVVKLWARN